MSRDTAVLNVPGIDEAMNRVLREEQQARVAVETCRERAKMLLEHAQNRAKLVEYRTDARLLRIQWLADRALQRALQGLAASASRSGRGPASAAVSDRLTRLIEVILDEMVGEGP
jgi:vacuolar-type H+-ATPase subunit H